MKITKYGYAVVRQDGERRWFCTAMFRYRYDAVTEYLERFSSTYKQLKNDHRVDERELVSVLWRNQSRRDSAKVARVAMKEV